MRLRDYTVSDEDPVSAKLFNQVTTDFSNAMAEAWLSLRNIKKKNEDFKSAADAAMGYLISRIQSANTALTGLKISAYNRPDSSDAIQLDHTFGQLTLAETDRISHIPVEDDLLGDSRALSSVGIEIGKTESTFAPDQDIRAIIDEENEIWMEDREAIDTDSGSIWIRITTPINGITPNFVSVYPLGGTIIQTIKVKRNNGYTEFTPSSTWPVKYHQNFSDYQNEIRIKITGTITTAGKYRFILKKADIYSVRYASQGTFRYTTTDTFSTVATVSTNTPYFYPASSQVPGSIRIRVYAIDGTTLLYDNSRETTAFVVPAGPNKVIVEGTLYRTDGNTPFIKSIT